MDLQVTQENFSKALGIVARVATGRTTLPILSNILLKISENRLLVSATNLDIAITVFVGAKVKKPGSVTIPARLAQDFVSSLPRDTINITQSDHKLHITSGNYDSIINGVSAEEFPVMPAIQEGVTWKVPAQTLKEALQQVVFSASGDEARPVLTGVFLRVKNDTLHIAATDGYRLAEKKIKDIKQDFNLLIPANALSDLLRIISDENEDVTVSHDDQQVQFVVGNTELVARLIEGDYPDYSKLIPSSFENKAEVNKEDLVNIAKVSSLFAREVAGSITVKVSEKDKQISVRSVASQVGENTAETEAIVTGEGEITLNSRYLLDSLSVIKSDSIEFCFNGKLDPIVIRAPKEKTYTHIIMPLKS